MALLDFIASQKTPMQTFLEELHKGTEERQKQQETDATAKYHEGMLGIQQQNLARMKEEAPLKYELLKAQVQAQQALAKQRTATAGMAGGLTKANVTKNQGIIQAIDNVTPLIDQLSDEKYDVPNQVWGQYLHPDQQRNYKAKTAAITDSLISAMGLPKTNESIHLASTMVERGKGESKEAHRDRLKELKQDLANRKQRAHQSIKSGFGDSGITAPADDPAQGQEADKNWVMNENGELVEG